MGQNDAELETWGLNAEGRYDMLGTGITIRLCCAGCGEIAITAGRFLDDGRWVCTKVCRDAVASSDEFFAECAAEHSAAAVEYQMEACK